MFISIITPTFNSEKTIQKTIESVADQCFDNYEHIIIDNLSTDNTLQILKKFNDKIKIITEKDKGIYFAMNKGANLSKGKNLLFLNSDDYILDNKFLENAYTIWQNYKYDILYSDILYEPNLFGVSRKYISGSYSLNSKLEGWHIPHPGSIINKDFFQNLGMFSTEFKIASDFDFFIKSQNIPNTKFYYYNNFSIKMSLGGASSGLLNIIKSNIECYQSLKKNKIKEPIYFVLKKLLKKFLQLF